MAEEWRPIPGYEQYEVSTLGNVRNKDTPKKFLKPFNVDDAYSQVRLSLGSRDKYKVIAVHRLVAFAWLDNPNHKNIVNHKNRNKYDNRVENLEWATPSEQALAVIATGRNKKKTHVKEAQHDLEGEIWKPIKTLPPYLVSNKGRIKRDGYVYTTYDDGRYIEWKSPCKKHVVVHRAVAEAFLSDFTKECVINHKDGNRKNNCVENLECVTQSENLQHAYDTGLNSRRIAVSQYDDKGNLIATFKSLLEAARVTTFKDGSIRWAIKNAEGRHGGFIWKVNNGMN